MVEQHEREAGHETRDISVTVIAWFAAGLIISAIAIYVAIAGLYRHFKRQTSSPEPASRIALKAPMVVPAPQLQVNPAMDFERFRAAEETQLNSYGWIDKKAGVIRIPIERAMDLIAERGLPTRSPGTQNSSGKTSVQMQQEKASATKP